jgi:formate dehydrogenase iron-sulfur subunit
VGGTGSLFLLLDRPQVYGLPEHPVTPTRRLKGIAGAAMVAAGMVVAGLAAALAGGARR